MKVVVIGAGVAGLGIGWKLAKAGASVTILERAQAGRGATTVSAGMIAAAAELGHADTPEAAFAKRANELWPGFVTELEAESGIPVDYRQNGALMVALDSGGRPSPPAQGADVAMLTAGQARAMEPMLRENIAGALWAPREAQIDTHALVRALVTAFAKAGGTILANETAVRIETEGGAAGVGRAFGVRTPFALHHADAYVIAAGAWSSCLEGLPPEAVPPVVPIKGEIVVLTPPVGAELPRHVVRGNGIYVVPRIGRLLVGATMERAGFDTGKTPEATRWLLGQATGLMPGLRGWEVAEHWAGLRPATPDGMPILGQTVVEGLYVASGQFRNGILFAPAIAEAMSRLILERVMETPAFDPRRFDGAKPQAPASAIETAHKAPGKETGFREWHTGF
ncbi:MAG TPA: glycine oxidase ThiO [Rhizomicrobium sp.]